MYHAPLVSACAKVLKSAVIRPCFAHFKQLLAALIIRDLDCMLQQPVPREMALSSKGKQLQQSICLSSTEKRFPEDRPGVPEIQN